MQSLYRLLCMFFAAAVLSACGHNESDERAALSHFLQTQVIDKPGLSVPAPSPEQRKAFGQYRPAFSVIYDFHLRMNHAVRNLGKTMGKGTVESLEEMLSRRTDIESALQELESLRQTIAQEQARADASKAALTLPPDLAEVFNQAYEQGVTMPARMLLEKLPVVEGAWRETLNLADFVQNSQGLVVVTGDQITAATPALEKSVDALLDNLDDHAQAVHDAQYELQTSFRGQ